MSAKIVTRMHGAAHLRSAAQLGLTGVSTGGTEGSAKYVTGLFSAANEWAEVASAVEGHFFERIAPGAFARSMKEDRGHIRVLYDHGQDPFIGRRPIASLDGLGEDARGAYYFGRLFDTLAARELGPLLEAGQLGSSMRFRVDRMTEDAWPARSDFNPTRLPQRVILEASLIELGPTPFPVYRGTTAGASTGSHPPRSRPAMSREAFLRLLSQPSAADTPERAAARRRWLDRVVPDPRARLAERRRWLDKVAPLPREAA